MNVVDAATRLDALTALGASAPLVRLASGDCVHPLLRGTCLGWRFLFLAARPFSAFDPPPCRAVKHITKKNK